MSNLQNADITSPIIKAFYKVYNTLGYGFLEKVYENSLVFELRQSGLKVEQQKPISVYYRENLVGEYFADLLVENCVIVELKTTETLSSANEAQLLNYLRATNIEVGLLLNFGQKPDYRRKFFTNNKKDLLNELINP